MSHKKSTRSSGLNPSPGRAMVFQFPPPTITNFSVNFRNPGNYNCLIDLNPCQEHMARSTRIVVSDANANFGGRGYSTTQPNAQANWNAFRPSNFNPRVFSSPGGELVPNAPPNTPNTPTTPRPQTVRFGSPIATLCNTPPRPPRVTLSPPSQHTSSAPAAMQGNRSPISLYSSFTGQSSR